jgi:hypothetical protein
MPCSPKTGQNKRSTNQLNPAPMVNRSDISTAVVYGFGAVNGIITNKITADNKPSLNMNGFQVWNPNPNSRTIKNMMTLSIPHNPTKKAPAKTIGIVDVINFTNIATVYYLVSLNKQKCLFRLNESH